MREFLEQDLLPRSRGVYAVGAEHYNLLLRKKHFLEHDAQSLLALGEELFAKTRRELAELSGGTRAGKGIEEAARAIQENHPSDRRSSSGLSKSDGSGAPVS